MQSTAGCENCGMKYFEDSGFGMEFCLQCGVGRKATSMLGSEQFVYKDAVLNVQSYTRLKRFKKYLCRAARQQSSCTIPKDTWDYLWSKRPYRNAAHIQYTLKQARHLKRKCYDSLPFLTGALCPHVDVPSLGEIEKLKAIDLFKRIDIAIGKGPFISYLFCLEYILKKLGRADMCEHINRIQCPKRREKYKDRLDRIFNSTSSTVNPFETLKRKIASKSTLAPNCPALLKVALLTGDVPSGSNVSSTSSLGKVRLDENLVVE